MARLDVTNIDMDEIHVKVGGTSGTSVSMNDADVRGMAAPDTSYSGNDGISTGNNSTIAIGEFRNGEHTSLDDFFGLGSWHASQVDSVANNSFGTAQAFAQMSFKNDTTNSRIEAVYYAGTTAAMATTYTSYIPYTGYTGNINVKYTTSGLVYADTNSGSYYYQPKGWPGNLQNPVVSGSMPYTNSRARKTSGTDYLIPTSGYVPFKWFVEGPTWTSGSYNQSGQDMVDHTFTFTVSFTSDSVLYSSTSATKYLNLYAGRGPIIL